MSQLTLNAQEVSALGLRERKKLATATALRAAALDLFRAKGFSATSVDEIARLAEVSRSTFFRYFRSKEDILFADEDVVGELFLRLLRDRPATEGPIEAFEEAMVDLAEQRRHVQQRDLTRVSEELIRNEPSLTSRRYRELERWTSLVSTVLAQRNGRSEPSSEDRVAAATCMAVSGEVGREWLEVDGPDAVEAIRTAFARLREAVGGAA